MNDLAAAPMVHAAYLLAREFGWTFQEILNLTPAQVDVLLELLKKDGKLN